MDQAFILPIIVSSSVASKYIRASGLRPSRTAVVRSLRRRNDDRPNFRSKKRRTPLTMPHDKALTFTPFLQSSHPWSVACTWAFFFLVVFGRRKLVSLSPVTSEGLVHSEDDPSLVDSCLGGCFCLIWCWHRGHEPFKDGRMREHSTQGKMVSVRAHRE